MGSELTRSLIVTIGMFAVLYFLLIRPQKKQEKEKLKMMEELVVGDKVITIGGVHGTIVVAKEDMVTIETGSTKSRLDISKWAVGTVVKD